MKLIPKISNNFLTLFVFVLFIFTFCFVLGIDSVTASCVPGSSCTMSNGCPGYMVCYPPPSTSGYCSQLPNCNLSSPKCGDGACNGTETCSSCPSDCGACGDDDDDEPCWSCTDWGKCSASGFQYRICSAISIDDYCSTVDSPAISQVCTPSCVESWSCSWSTCVNGIQTKKCTDLNNCGTTTGKPPAESQACTVCTDTDNGKDYNVKGVVTDGYGTFTDLCYASSGKLFEYYCDKSLGYAQGEWHVCPYGCSNAVCNKCVPTKTCAKDYKGQCAKNLDEGCGYYSLDCSNNCSKGQYCNATDGKCTKTSPKTCCVGVYGEHEDPCTSITNETECKTKNLNEQHPELICSWSAKKKPKCQAKLNLKNEAQKMIKNASPKCDKTKLIPLNEYTPSAVSKFFESNNCKIEKIFVARHGTPEMSNEVFQTASECISCTGGQCLALGLTYKSCSVAQNDSLVDQLALGLQKQLKDNGNTETVVEINIDQAVNSIRNETTREIYITGNDYYSKYFSCDVLHVINEEDGGCYGDYTMQARNEKVLCTDSSGKNNVAMCCQDTETANSPYWYWVYVDSKNPQCPSALSFNSTIENIAGLLKPIGDALNNTVVIVSSAVAGIGAGAWWIFSKIFLKK